MQSRNIKYYSLILIIVDLLVLLTAFVLAYIWRVQIDHRPLLYDVYAFDYLQSIIFIIPFWILIFSLIGLYRPATYNRRFVEYSKIAIGSLVGILFAIGWQYMTDIDIFPARLVPVYALVGSISMLIFERETMRVIRSVRRLLNKGIDRVLIIGESAATKEIAQQLSNTEKSGYKVAAIAGPRRVVPKGLRIKNYSFAETAMRDIKKNRINTIIQTDLYDSSERNQQILEAAQSHHINYSFIPGETEFYSGKNTVDVFLGYPMISVYQTPLIGWGAIFKRAFDLIVGMILLIILSPILLTVYIIKKIADPGPAFYVSKRLSRFSEPIDLIKFRSMDSKYGSRDAAEEFADMGRPDLVKEYNKNRKVTNDPRITKFGKFLRSTSIDELPQIFNVIRGDLSLVGPRPILPQEVSLIRGRASLLHSVKSGVTGLWQVSGRNELSFDERISLELFYAQNWTFWLDIKILFKTVGVVFKRKGAK